MKVLMINSVCGIRSTGRICTDLAVELEKQGHEVKIAYGREFVPEQFRRFAVRIGTDADVNLHAVKARLFDAMGFGSKHATEKFIQWVKEYDPDVIHLHNIHGYYIQIEILFDYLRTCGKKIIWTLHDCWAFTGHSAYCDAINCTKWKTGCCDCPQKSVYPRSFSDFSSRNWKKKKELFTGIPDLTIVTPSHWLEGLVRESFLKEYPTEVIHNGIDTGVFKPTESDFRDRHGLHDKIIVLGVAAGWDKRKGFEDFIKLGRLLDDKYQIILVGKNSSNAQTIHSGIMAIPSVDIVKELAEIYSAADVFVNPTYEEVYGLVNAEAILCGTPVVCYDTGGCAEVVGQNGIIVERGNVKGICQALADLREKPMVISPSVEWYDKRIKYWNYASMYET